MSNNCLLPILLSEWLKKIVFEIEEIEGDLNSKDGQIKMHSMREDVFEKRSRN